MPGILKLTDSIVRPFLSFAGVYASLVAIVAVVAARGLLYSLFSFTIPLTLPAGLLISSAGFLNFFLQFLFIVLSFSVLFSRYGLHATGNVFVEFIHDIAFSLFRLVGKIVWTKKVPVLFIFAVIFLIALHSGLGTLLSGGSIGPKATLAYSCDQIVRALGFFIYILVFHALISWVRPDPYAEPVQLLNALSSPFLSTIRKIFPWTVVGGFDLSTIIAILGIVLIQTISVNLINALLLK